MFRPVNRGSRRAQSRTHMIPAPVSGWNARDSIAAMRSGDAVKLDNVWPENTFVSLRKGSEDFATGIDIAAVEKEVETLIAYRALSGTQKLWAFAGTAIFDVTSGGVIGAGTVTGLTNALWQCENFTTSGGHFLLCVNGADLFHLYDGSNWTAIDGASTPAITNVTTSNLINVNIFKQRPWYIEKNSLSVWYPAVGAFAGALTELDLSGVFSEGGYLVAMGTWPVDGGYGKDDLAVFITSEGEVAVYQGTDPASAATWALVGTYKVGKPIGRRCFQKFGPELLILTSDGVVPASAALANNQTKKSIAITDRIQGAMARAVALYGGVTGWGMTHYAEGNLLLLNIPVGSGQQEQYVMNTVTRAWARFTGWHANCWEEFNGEIYFGGFGVVTKAWIGTSDNGSQVRGEVVTAFDPLGSSGWKQAVLARPLIAWDVPPDSILLGVDGDFKIETPTSQIPLSAGTSSVWDTATFDVSTWAGDPELRKDWFAVEGVGFALALHLVIVADQSVVQLAAAQIAYLPGESL